MRPCNADRVNKIVKAANKACIEKSESWAMSAAGIPIFKDSGDLSGLAGNIGWLEIGAN